MVLGIVCVGVHHILLRSAVVAHLACLAFGVLLDGVLEGLAARHLEDTTNFGKRLIVYFTQCTSTLLAITL